MRKNESAVRDRCEEVGVDLRVSPSDSFMARISRSGHEDIRRSFRWCRDRMFCPILDNGRIYPCAPAHFPQYFNDVAGTHIPEDAGIDIHSSSARDILLYLMRSPAACRHCVAGARSFAWKPAKAPEEWLFDTNEK